QPLERAKQPRRKNARRSQSGVLPAWRLRMQKPRVPQADGQGRDHALRLHRGEDQPSGRLRQLPGLGLPERDSREEEIITWHWRAAVHPRRAALPTAPASNANVAPHPPDVDSTLLRDSNDGSRPMLSAIDTVAHRSPESLWAWFPASLHA